MESIISNQILLKEKLGFFGILKEAAKIPFKNLNFIIFTCLTLLPLLYSLSIYESMFTQTIIEAAKVLREEAEAQAKMESDCILCSHLSWVEWTHVTNLDYLIGKISQKLVILVLSHIGILHLCDLISTIATVNSSSLLYAGHKADSSLKEMFTKHVMDARLKGPLITSIYAMLFASVSLLGLFSLLLYVYVMGATSPLFMIIFLIMFVAMLGKYLEWLAVWDMGVVISILEEKEGDVAIVISSYLSGDNRRTGIFLMAGFVLWRVILRVMYVFLALNGGGSKIWVLVVHVVLFGFTNVFKWVCFVVYYVDCKKIRSKKEVSLVRGDGVLSV
ncbi:hypothetical protein HN51_041654 [Arachis hypogaea]|uniref:Transmembrane protein n=1 Tax=Arachis hypogaea TaxID=3818 RepID=A0A444YTD6_ARAHY|nr:uncharacterized protein LOC107605321 [Arachis ipaensis]XP_025658990.1 uncharacterized protein LOC112755241 [Arachis hypogaea]QHN87451.1 uncharacterized protein DS421_16g555210 [Arachis hypogaea]RYR05203.1 hypothetical protein Ahy_B06g085081 [Arachis hypogaea]